MFRANVLEKVALATIGTTGAFLAAHKLKALPGYFDAHGSTDARDVDAAQQRVNSFAAGIIAGGIATAVVFAIWEK